ncbi:MULTISPECIES: potassium channel family protein [unclassified Streptomyces]|uniref:potassium channel family protein n=1 Tax=unclassified Streptomyces TaxID=2593676 RepID=UPI002254E761|nr:MULTISPECIES: potassium channel family protein [unclassified Streptomyces]MCX5336487.1 potassium channel family protein [Streptomyces sp. NBC_00140]MCX5367215.1 potassium channel family protein [Streptomyces sp. NBC_00124]
MSTPQESDPGRRLRPRRVRLLLPLLRSTAAVAATTVAYYLLPMDRDFDQHTATVLGMGLLGIGALLALQAVSIIGSPHPRLRAIEALTTAVPLFLLLFSATYFLYAQEQGAHTFSEPLSRNDALYFTVTVFATVGFGDIVPVAQTARVLTTCQMVADLILVGMIAKVMVGAVRLGLERRQSSPATEERAP